MGCCNTRTLNDDPKRENREEEKNDDRFSVIENKFSDKNIHEADKMISKTTTLYDSLLKKITTLEKEIIEFKSIEKAENIKNEIECDNGIDNLTNGINDVEDIDDFNTKEIKEVEINPIDSNQNMQYEKNQTESTSNQKEENIKEDAGKRKKKHKITLTVRCSSPQKLDPEKVFFIENTNIVTKSYESEAEKAVRKLARLGTLDRVLEEKIRNKVNFEDLIQEDIFKKIIK
jgi:hypothetical protein